MAEKEAEGTEKEAAGKTKLDTNKLLSLVLAAFNLLALGGGGYLVHKATLGYEMPTVREPAALAELNQDRENTENAEPVMYTMEPLTVNLNGTPQRMIRLEMTLEMLDKEGFEEVVTLGPRARDTVVQILNNKEFKDVETIQGKLFLKDQIAINLNQFMKKGVVKDVYFSGFLVQ